MRHYTSILLFALVIIIVACSNNNDAIGDEILLNGKSIKIDSSNKIKFPRILIGDILISNQIFGRYDYCAGILKNNQWASSKNVFNIGHGHNEFTWIRFAKQHDNSLLLLDGFGQPFSMTVIPDIKSIDDIKEYSKWKKYDLKNVDILDFASNFYPMSDSTILVAGTPQKYPGHIMSIVNYKKQTCVPLDYWPDDGIDIDSLPKHNVYGSYSLTFGNGKGHYLYLCGRERYSFIFSINGNKVNVVKNLYTTYSNYSTKDHMNPIKKQVRTEGLACATNNDHIYLLLTETDRKGDKIDIEDYKHQNLYGNIVEMYDWNGNLLKRLKFDHLGQNIMLSDDNKSLYLFSNDYFEGDINPQIWVYNLNDVE